METLFTVREWRVVRNDFGRIEITRTNHPESVFLFDETSREVIVVGTDKRFPTTIRRFLDSIPAPIVEVIPGFSNRTFGVEIEFFHPTDPQIVTKIISELRAQGITAVKENYNHETKPHWKITTDSSVNSGCHDRGLEMVSPILRGKQGLDALRRVLKVMRRLGCQVDRTCGVHVHHGAKDLSSEEIRSVFKFYRNNERIIDTLVSPSRRANNNGYCRSLNSGYIGVDIPDCRYYKVNYQSYLKYGTIEFRQHQGSLDYEKISHWIMLTQNILEKAIQDTQPCQSLTEMLNKLGLNTLALFFENRQFELAGGE